MSAWEDSNQNESLNGTIWSRVPQEVFVGRDILEFGLYDAISQFNMGSEAVLLLYEALQIACGFSLREDARSLTQSSGTIQRARCQQEEKKGAEKAQKEERGQKQQSEETTYAAGQF